MPESILGLRCWLWKRELRSQRHVDLREFLGYALGMRFRAKFGALGWCWVGLGCGWVFFGVFGNSGSAPGLHGFNAVIFALLALQQIFFHLFIYWEIDSNSLRVHRFWTTKEIAWADITHVGGANGRPSAAFLDVYYARSAPMSDRGHFLANPEDRRGFIEELRKFAPQAEFEV